MTNERAERVLKEYMEERLREYLDADARLDVPTVYEGMTDEEIIDDFNTYHTWKR